MEGEENDKLLFRRSEPQSGNFRRWISPCEPVEKRSGRPVFGTKRSPSNVSESGKKTFVAQVHATELRKTRSDIMGEGGLVEEPGNVFRELVGDPPVVKETEGLKVSGVGPVVRE